MIRVLLLATALLLCSVPSASAEPALRDASPHAESRISVAPQRVRLTFDRPVAGAGPYSITVTGGGEVWSEPMIGVDDTVVTVPLRLLPSTGEYLVSYRVTPPDGTVLAGRYRFFLGGSAPTPWWVWMVVTLGGVAMLVVAFRLARHPR
ncbi:copper resistance CopC family protein [Lentzea albidocapillata]|uniref:CopC domain-containing protein n=1 Tax=Lentzea albidocapillata TaxID=40571 RepID=A0A1W2FJB8_9PSEU|nr:copper resistance CopC family protein [Lentzea albidocapillata]SMD22027.1 hypothetical protein SAMN05660733_06557 [Lentzea albidocapillata]